ncbi:YceD family protein [Siminovitchia sediminis]|uniref:YceD family protein n=1 Tax=Siminovitchia sediminis TaxID=1274353 RepID=A0ABW4KDB5_9BACI
MKWTVAELLKYRNETMMFDKHVDLAQDLKKADPEIRKASLIHVEGRADVDTNKASFHLHISGTLTLPCARTLVDVNYPLDIHSVETFLLKPLDYDHQEDEDIHEVEGGVIDLTPVVYELVLLDVPIQVISPEAENDLSMPQGPDWKVMTEEQLFEARDREKKKVDPRLADLAKLLPKNENENQK